jgi:CHAT domain-containing protein
VLDPPTALLMVQLYHHLLAGQGVSTALREAQLWMKELSREQVVAQVIQCTPAADQSLSSKNIEAFSKWVQSLGPEPFAHPYYWGAFQELGSSDPAFQALRG